MFELNRIIFVPYLMVKRTTFEKLYTLVVLYIKQQNVCTLKLVRDFVV
jgi:hypothetical protein